MVTCSVEEKVLCQLILFLLHLSEHVLFVEPSSIMDVKLLSALAHRESVPTVTLSQLPSVNASCATLLADREHLKIQCLLKPASVHDTLNLLHLPTGDRFRADADSVCTQALLQI